MNKPILKLVSDENGVYRTQHFYRDSVTAMIQHMNNLINTYGKDQVANIVRYLIEQGAFNDDDKKG